MGISGSLRASSTNTILLSAATKLPIEGAQLAISRLLGDLPLFNPDLEVANEPSVLQWTQVMRSADGIVLCTPEYARGYPGALKNAFDWLVGGDGFVEKPFMFLSASSRAQLSKSSLTTVLETMSGVYMQQADATIPLLGTQLTVEDILVDAAYKDAICSALTTFCHLIRERQ